MDNYQKIEQLVSSTNCSYEDARTALENCDWDMIDAVISLEREGKIRKETAEKTTQRPEEPIEIIPEVLPSDRKSDDNDTKQEEPKRECRLCRLWRRLKSIMLNNRMMVLRSSGQVIMDLPILIPAMALMAFFWPTLIIAVVAMVFGCRFHFEGEDLGKTNINSTMDKATDYAEKVKDDLSKKVNNNEQNTDN